MPIKQKICMNLEWVLQNPTLASVVISGKGTLTNVGYAGYVTVTVSTVSTLPSNFINYTVDDAVPTCRPTEAPPPPTFILSSTAEVTAYLTELL
jgi:hypothetical protein